MRSHRAAESSGQGQFALLFVFEIQQFAFRSQFLWQGTNIDKALATALTDSG